MREEWYFHWQMDLKPPLRDPGLDNGLQFYLEYALGKFGSAMKDFGKPLEKIQIIVSPPRSKPPLSPHLNINMLGDTNRYYPTSTQPNKNRRRRR